MEKYCMHALATEMDFLQNKEESQVHLYLEVSLRDSR